MSDFHEAWKRARMACNSRRKIYPPRVDVYDNGERYYSNPPPVVSPRCLHVLRRIKEGWRPRIHNGYYGNAVYLGVYVWEYLELVYYALHDPTRAQWRIDDQNRPVRI